MDPPDVWITLLAQPQNDLSFPHSKGEFPHLAFLLVGYPVLAAISLSCYLICAPTTVWSFSIYQYKQFKSRWLVKAIKSRNQVQPVDGPQGLAEEKNVVSYLRVPWEHLSNSLLHGGEDQGKFAWWLLPM